MGSYLFGGINYASPNSSNFHIRYCTTQSEKGRIISKFHENQNGKYSLALMTEDCLFMILFLINVSDI